MNKFIKMLLACLCITSTACGQKEYTDLDTDAFEAYISQHKTDGVQIIDVRTPGEYAEGTIPGAVLLDVKDDAFAAKGEAMLDKGKPVAVFCRSGRRSAAAASILTKKGFKNVANLIGGFLAWQKAEKTVVTPDADTGM